MLWRLLPYQLGSPAYNMAVDEAVFNLYLKDKTPPTLRFYGWNPPSVSIGFFQDLHREINHEAIKRKGIGLVRRNTGGRAVLHDQELTYSVVAGVKDGLPDNLLQSYLVISKVLAAALFELGVKVELHQGAAMANSSSGACFESPSWYEQKVGGRKLIGSAQLRQGGSFLQHGSILLDFKADDLIAVINHSNGMSDEFRQRISDRVTSLKELGVLISPEELAEQIGRSLIKQLGVELVQGELSTEEVHLAEILVNTKYASEAWNYSRGKSQRQMLFN